MKRNDLVLNEDLEDGRLALRKVNAWNARYPIGTAVVVRKDNGNFHHGKTRTKAEVLSGHTPVVWVEGITGCYLLDRVAPVGPAR